MSWNTATMSSVYVSPFINCFFLFSFATSGCNIFLNINVGCFFKNVSKTDIPVKFRNSLYQNENGNALFSYFTTKCAVISPVTKSFHDRSFIQSLA